MSRIDQCFSALKKASRPALIPFIMGGDPTIAASLEVLKSLKVAGADIIEIGMPFSDPMADGPLIQAAGLRALEGGANVAAVLNLVKQYRESDAQTPLILMGYFNPIFHYGAEAFCKDASAAGVDGLIIVDLPPEEESEFRSLASHAKLDFIRLIAPTSSGERLAQLVKSSSGYIYYIAIKGITGAAGAVASDLKHNVAAIKALTDLPIAVGFGIKTPQQAKDMAEIADGIVVGSALVDTIASNKGAEAKAAGAFVTALAEALRK